MKDRRRLTQREPQVNIFPAIGKRTEGSVSTATQVAEHSWQKKTWFRTILKRYTSGQNSLLLFFSLFSSELRNFR